VSGINLSVGSNNVILKNDNHLSCDKVVLALPPAALKKIISNSPALDAISDEFKLKLWYSNPISALYLWAKQRPILDAFTCSPEGPADWIFDYTRIWNDRRAPICLLLGNRRIERSQEWISDIIKSNAALFPQLRGIGWSHWKLVSESHATPQRPRELWGRQLPQRTSIPNLFFAGDWLGGELPPTVEAAVKSGKSISDLMVK